MIPNTSHVAIVLPRFLLCNMRVLTCVLQQSLLPDQTLVDATAATATMDSVTLKGLNDKIYDKRKAAALSLETSVLAMTAYRSSGWES